MTTNTVDYTWLYRLINRMPFSLPIMFLIVYFLYAFAIYTTSNMRKRCLFGTRRNKHTGICEPLFNRLDNRPTTRLSKKLNLNTEQPTNNFVPHKRVRKNNQNIVVVYADNDNIRDYVKQYCERGLDAGLGDINDWNVSQVRNMDYLFASTDFNGLIDKWDVRNVVSMECTFKDAKKYNQPLNSWNVENVKYMLEMFHNATSFNQPLDHWNVTNVKNMLEMFHNATSFNQPLDHWNVTNVEDMSLMFSGATSFNQSINNWDISMVIDMEFMFEDATHFNQPLHSWGPRFVPGVNRDFMFSRASSFDHPLDTWTIYANENLYLPYNFNNKRPLQVDFERPPVTDTTQRKLHRININRQNNQTDELGTRITIAINAHGGDLYAGKTNYYKFALDTNNITVMNCGSGQCGLVSYANAALETDIHNTVIQATRPHHPNTYQTMEQLQPKLRQIYKDQYKYHDFSATPANYQKTIENNEHCKIYHPQHDRYYSENPGAFKCTIAQVFNSPYNELIGLELYDPIVIEKITQVVGSSDIIQKITDAFSSKDEYIIKLSDIIAVCNIMGFELVNVYEFACRTLIDSDFHKIDDLEYLDEINKKEGDTLVRKSRRRGGYRSRPLAKTKTNKNNSNTKLNRSLIQNIPTTNHYVRN